MPNIWWVLFADTVRLRREELDMSQAELAARLHTTQQTVSRWEAGATIPRPRRIVRLADVLGLEAGELHRIAGYIKQPERSDAWDDVHDLVSRIGQLSDLELMLLIDAAWQELRVRRGLSVDIPRRPPR